MNENNTGRYLTCDFHKVIGGLEVFYDYQDNKLSIHHVLNDIRAELLGTLKLSMADFNRITEVLHKEHFVRGVGEEFDTREDNEVC